MIATPPRSRPLSRAIERMVSSSPRMVIRATRWLVASAAAATVRGSLPSGRTMCCGLDAARWRMRSRISMDGNVATEIYKATKKHKKHKISGSHFVLFVLLCGYNPLHVMIKPAQPDDESVARHTKSSLTLRTLDD